MIFYLALCFIAFFVLFINPKYHSLFGTWWMSSLFCFIICLFYLLYYILLKGLTVNVIVIKVGVVSKRKLLDVASEVCGYTKGKPRYFETWWWNKDVDVAVCRKRELFRIWKQSRNRKIGRNIVRQKKMLRCYGSESSRGGGEG